MSWSLPVGLIEGPRALFIRDGMPRGESREESSKGVHRPELRLVEVGETLLSGKVPVQETSVALYNPLKDIAMHCCAA